MDDIEDRLSSHARAFEGLMSLIPAKQYYAEDTSDQWKRKKQTKEQKRAAKLAKLDPANHKTAADVMAENERKRKRELAGEESDTPSDLNAPGKEQPREGLKTPAAKKQKVTTDETPETEEKPKKTSRTPEEIEARRKAKAEKKAEKLKQHKEKKQNTENPAEAPASNDVEMDDAKPENEDVDTINDQDEEPAPDPAFAADDMDKVDISGLEDAEQSRSTSPEETETPKSPASVQRSASSSSSIIPSASVEDDEKPAKPKKANLPKIDHEALGAKLKAKIEALRAARKADGIDGKPARNRAELMEARRRKEEERKQRKKEQRKLAKEEEDRIKAEAELAQLRGSGSPLTPDIFSPARSPDHYNFSFGKVTFGDGHQLDPSGTSLQELKRRKGPQDPKTALEAAKKKETRINGLDEEKRADIESKDAWLKAKQRAHGERVKDDVSLLKKTLKRKEKQKAKSEKEWNGRIEGVKKSQEAKQKKREDNLRKRKEEKGGKGKKTKTAPKKKGRPGFEGRFGK